MRISTSLATTSFCGLVFCSTVFAQATTRVSVDSGEVQGNDNTYRASISADGRYVAFEGQASNLVGGDLNGFADIFVRDRLTGTTERVNLTSGGTEATANCFNASISADGRYVTFWSTASDLVAGDTNSVEDVFVRDRLSATTDLVSVDSSETQGNSGSGESAISADGRYVAFASVATNLVGVDTNAAIDVFVRDLVAGTTERVSVGAGGVQANNASGHFAISADGRYVTFISYASNLVAGDTNGFVDVFVRDRVAGTTDRVSVSSAGTQGNHDSSNATPSISDDGRYVAFQSPATTLVAGDANGTIPDIYVRDRVAGTTARVSVASGGAQGNSDSYEPSISGDGRYVAFESLASNLVAGDTNARLDIFLRDRQANTTARVSVDSGGAQSNDPSGLASISADGRYVAFHSYATNLVAGDTNGFRDVFVHDRPATGFTSLCDPGAGGVQACPCSNPPGGAGRGCNNSSGTGGAILAASGVAYLSMDSLVFTTSGERPTATSILLQGTTSAAAGIVYGQGIRCVAGSLKRLFQKSAVAGSITVPNFGAGDPTVSARSAATGDVISAGQSRWYLVFYRDPTVLGGCPAASAFNTTQSGRVDWSL